MEILSDVLIGNGVEGVFAVSSDLLNARLSKEFDEAPKSVILGVRVESLSLA